MEFFYRNSANLLIARLHFFGSMLETSRPFDRYIGYAEETFHAS